MHSSSQTLGKWEISTPRFVIDYRGLNAVTKGDGYPIPNVSSILDMLNGGKLFAKLDLASGYWQVPVNPQHKEKTAFATHLVGLFHNLRLPFGLKTAPQCFQRILTQFSQTFCTNGSSSTSTIVSRSLILLLRPCFIMNLYYNVL